MGEQQYIIVEGYDACNLASMVSQRMAEGYTPNLSAFVVVETGPSVSVTSPTP